MRLVRRILITVIVTLTVIFLGVSWIAPVALSFYAAKQALPVARIVPTDLRDQSVSQTSGTKLSYVGYEFEVPWGDLDESKTELYPKDKPNKNRVILRFRSGLRLMVSAIPSRVWANQFATDFRMSPQKFEAIFGHGVASSDYDFVKNLYEFTPNKMHHWSLSSDVHYREEVVLMIKSIAPVKAAETGIFNLHNQSYKGFQQGNPQASRDSLVVDLYPDDSNDGSVDFMFMQNDYHNPAGVTQPEINRIVQSLHKTAPAQSTPLPSGKS